MTEGMKALLADYEAKGKERDALLAKGAAFTADDDAKVKSINGELTLMKSRFEGMKAAAEDEFLKGAAPKLELPAGTAPEVKGILGWVPTEAKESERVGPALNYYDVKSAVLGEFGETKANILVSDNYKRAFFKMIIAGGFEGLGATDRKDLEAGLDPQGGYTLPVDLINRLVQRKATPTRLAGMVTGIGTSSSAIEMPTVKGGDNVYPTGIRTSWVGEKTTAAAHRVNDANMFGKKRIEVHQLMLSIPLTETLLEDSSFDLEGWVSARFGEANDLETDRVVLAGSGVNQPHGIITRARAAYDDLVVVNTGDANLLTYDGLAELSEGLPEQYDENARFTYAKTTTGVALRKLKDDTGHPLFTYGNQDNGIASGRPRQLMGYDYTWSGFHESVAAGNYPIVFGDMSGYVLARRIAFSVRVLNERYAEEGLIVLLGRSRFGGDVVEPWKLRAQKVAA